MGFKVHKGHGLHTARTACAEQIQREREQVSPTGKE